ncbi:helix-turn-helix domain-containing protein [Clostridium oryzae]|uniref:Helix-turn-helix protein n=1 Tax=Clostridium oryzae TaxID=1450648 RepID=A0A1V4IEL1_9CLOT|nr:helix-turn-helix transcriptional regulator [Clostridium oryzae]OPJ58448.1 helix-turn-helix protein [Clostridium oryzae]
MERTEVLRKLIDNSNMSVKAFASKADLPYSTLRSILERGVGNASVDNVIKICKALGITLEQLDDMSEKEDICINETSEFNSPEAAMQFILKQPALAAYGGYEPEKMSDDEIIEFANELLRQLKLLGYKYSK